MNSVLTCKALGIATAFSLLTACGSGYGGGITGATSPSQDAISHMRGNASISKLSGEYSGTEKENGVSYHVYGSLAQYHNAVGGEIKIKKPTGVILNHVAFTVNGTKLTGTNVSPSATSYCTFSEKAIYDAKTQKLNGSFKAVYGCSGDTGTFTVKQKCYYKGNPTEDIRPESGPHPC